MTRTHNLLTGTLLAAILTAGLAAPSFAAKLSNTQEVTPAPSITHAITAGGIDFGDDTSEWSKDGECDDPRFEGEGVAAELLDVDRMHDATDCKAAFDAGTVTLIEGNDTPVANAEIDFGDDTSEWSKDGECDDPRFEGEGAAAELLDEDRMHDATDCQAAFEAGTVTLIEGQDTNNTQVANTDIDFGDNSSQWANDGECDDPRFEGEGSAAELLDEDRLHDAADCQAAFEAGTVTLKDAGSTDVADIDFGDDTSDWANDGECDDPRFEGEGSAAELLDADRMHDATDCQAAFNAGTITLKAGGSTDVADIDFGDDSSEWNNDGECDDPRFEGSAMASDPTNTDLLKDATDCRTAFEAGTVTLKADAGDIVAAANEFDYGTDFSRWANDGECDDKRFVGEGMAKKLLSEDTQGDATDCRALVEAGSISIIPVYDPAYAAGAPYDTKGVDFGDNTSSYADDGQCDDPRFQGPGTASTLLDSDLKHDRNDCRAAFEAGTVILL